MCWSNHFIPDLQIAKENIPIFKVLNDDFTAYYYVDFIYNLNEEYKTVLGDPTFIRRYSSWIVNNGFHSYSKSCVINIESINSICIYSPRKVVNDYYHNFLVVDGIIPKGSKYYINIDGEYVSNIIKLIKVRNLC